MVGLAFLAVGGLLGPPNVKGATAVKKSELIEKLSSRFGGNKEAAAHALESVADTIAREVAKGEKVVVKGLGTFEKVVVEKSKKAKKKTKKPTHKPGFSASREFHDVVSGAKKLPKLAKTRLAAVDTAKVEAVAAVAEEKVEAAVKKAAPVVRKAAATAAQRATPVVEKAAATPTAQRATTAAKKAAASPAVKKATTAARRTVKRATPVRRTPPPTPPTPPEE